MLLTLLRVRLFHHLSLSSLTLRNDNKRYPHPTNDCRPEKRIKHTPKSIPWAILHPIHNSKGREIKLKQEQISFGSNEHCDGILIAKISRHSAVNTNRILL